MNKISRSYVNIAARLRSKYGYQDLPYCEYPLSGVRKNHRNIQSGVYAVLKGPYTVTVIIFFNNKPVDIRRFL